MSRLEIAKEKLDAARRGYSNAAEWYRQCLHNQDEFAVRAAVFKVVAAADALNDAADDIGLLLGLAQFEVANG